MSGMIGSNIDHSKCNHRTTSTLDGNISNMFISHCVKYYLASITEVSLARSFFTHFGHRMSHERNRPLRNDRTKSVSPASSELSLGVTAGCPFYSGWYRQESVRHCLPALENPPATQIGDGKQLRRKEGTRRMEVSASNERSCYLKLLRDRRGEPAGVSSSACMCALWMNRREQST